MTGTPEQQKHIPTFSELYPHLTEQERADAEDRFDRYLALAVRIFKRLESDPSFPENLRTLTAERDDLTMNAERSIEKETNENE
jgi:hypothetical protein